MKAPLIIGAADACVCGKGKSDHVPHPNFPPVVVDAARDVALDAIPHALAALARAAISFRSAAIDLHKTLGTAQGGDAARAVLALRAMTTEPNARHIGIVTRIIDEEMARHGETMTTILRWIGASGESPDFPEHVGEGVLSAAISCPCNACPTCEARDRARAKARERKEEEETEIRAAVIATINNDRDASNGIVDAQGSPLRSTPRIIV